LGDGVKQTFLNQSGLQQGTLSGEGRTFLVSTVEFSNIFPKLRGAQHSCDCQNGFVSYMCYGVCIERRDVYEFRHVKQTV